MKAVVTMELNADGAESAQKIMEELCEALDRKQTIASYRTTRSKPPTGL